MNQNPHVSEFTLHSELPHPPHPLLVRSRHIHQRIEQLPTSITRPKEIIIDVKNNSDTLQTGVRHHIDACLDAIERVYWQKKQHSNKYIHRVDTRLILDYMQTVKQDYKVKDRFFSDNFEERQSNKNIVELTSPHSPARRPHSQDSRMKKQYIQLTQSSKREKRTFSTNKTKIPQQTTPRNQQLVNIYHLSPAPSPTAHHQIYPNHRREQLAVFNPNIIWAVPQKHPRQPKGKSQQKVRYCINCEQTILNMEIDDHEKLCDGFEQLYKLSFSQLAVLLGSKIQKMATVLQQLVEQLNSQKTDLVAKEILTSIERYLKSLTLISSNSSSTESQQLYYNFRVSLDNDLEKAIELIHKLHWFNQVRTQLLSQQSNQQSAPKNSQQKLQTILCVPSILHGILPPPSPISQFQQRMPRFEQYSSKKQIENSKGEGKQEQKSS